MPWTSKAVQAAKAAHARAALYGHSKPQKPWPWAIERNKELIIRFYGPGMWTIGVPKARSKRLLRKLAQSNYTDNQNAAKGAKQ